MDLAAVFAVALLGGYYFSSLWRLTAYATRRVEGQRLYFRAALAGAVLFVLSVLVRDLLLVWVPAYQDFDQDLLRYFRAAMKGESGLSAADLTQRTAWLVAAIYSLVLGPLAAGILNLVTPQRWALLRTLRGLDRLLLRAQRDDMPVLVTLTSGKLYIGLVISISDPQSDPNVIQLLPMFSGYRDPRGRMALTTDYEKVYGALQAGKATALHLSDDWLAEFVLVIRTDLVATATLFSPAVHAQFNPDWVAQIAHQNDPAPPQELIVELKRGRRAGTGGAAEDGSG